MGANTSKFKLSPKSIRELCKQVNFTAEEIKIWYNEYMKGLSKGESELTRKQFHEMYNSMFSGDPTDFADHVFRTFDTDGNGSVNFEEFVIGLNLSSNIPGDAQLKWAFDMYDIDGDGQISRTEMRTIVSVSIRNCASPYQRQSNSLPVYQTLMCYIKQFVLTTKLNVVWSKALFEY